MVTQYFYIVIINIKYVYTNYIVIINSLQKFSRRNKKPEVITNIKLNFGQWMYLTFILITDTPWWCISNYGFLTSRFNNYYKNKGRKFQWLKFKFILVITSDFLLLREKSCNLVPLTMEGIIYLCIECGSGESFYDWEYLFKQCLILHTNHVKFGIKYMFPDFTFWLLDILHLLYLPTPYCTTTY